MSVLERGGNAFDAAAAAGFVLQVVEPHLNGPGGEVPILLWDEREQRTHVVCGQGVAPAAATLAQFEDLGLDLVPGTGLLPATVPGAFGGWIVLLRRWGTWRLREVLDYAIGYCHRGYPALARIVDTITAVADLFRDHWPTSAATWLPGAAPPRPGALLTNPGLAATYERILAEAERRAPTRDGQLAAAHDLWYQGFVAEAVDDFCATTTWRDTSGRRHPGLLTGHDLATWTASVEPPATADYRDYTVAKTGLWGQGPVFLQQLALLDGLDLDTMPYGGDDYLHSIVECAKLAFADREAWYGDSQATPDTLDWLLSPEYTNQRRRLVTPEASHELRPGAVDGRTPRLPNLPDPRRLTTADDGVGEPTVALDGRTRGDTCHLDVVDVHGNMVSATPSGGWLQSSPTIPELGFCLGTRAQMFWLTNNLPNTLRPGARPRTTLSPSLAFRDGRPWLAFGTPGGDQQDQWSLHFFLSVVHGGHTLQEAIEAPAFHTRHFPSSFYPRTAAPGHVTIEDRVDPQTLNRLRTRGHHLELAEPWSVGHLSAVAREHHHLTAAANPRGAQGYAAGR